jgi:hypothetical protein
MVIKSGDEVVLTTLEEAMKYIEQLEIKYKATQDELLQSLETNEDLFAEISTLYDKLKINQNKFNSSYKELELSIESTDVELNDLSGHVLQLTSQYTNLQSLHAQVKAELSAKTAAFDDLQTKYQELLQSFQDSLPTRQIHHLTEAEPQYPQDGAPSTSSNTITTNNLLVIQHNSALNTQIDQLRDENQQLKNQIHHLQSSIPMAPSISSNSSSIYDMDGDDEGYDDPVFLRKQLSIIRADHSKNRTLVKQLEISNTKLTSQLASLQTEHSLNPDRTSDDLKAKLQECEDLKGDKMMLDNQILQLQTQLKHSLDKNSQHDALIINLNKQANELHQINHKLSAEFATTSSKLQTVSDELAQCKSRALEQQQKSNLEVEKAEPRDSSKIVSLQTQLKTQSQRILSLEDARTDDYAEFEREKQELEAKYAEVADKHNIVSQKYENLKEMYYDLESALQTKSSQLKSVKSELDEIKSAKSLMALDQIDETPTKSHPHKEGDDIFSKNQQLKQLYQVIAHLESTIAKLTSTNEANQAQIVKLLDYEEGLLETNSELQQKVNQLIQLENGLLKSQDSLSNGVEISSDEYSRLLQKHQTLLQDYNQLKIKLHSAEMVKSNSPTSTQACPNHLQQIAQLQDEVDHLNQIIQTQDEQLTIYHDDIDQLTLWAESLYAKLAEQCIPSPQEIEVRDENGHSLNDVLSQHVELTTTALDYYSNNDGANNSSHSAATNSSTSSNHSALEKSNHQLRRALAVKEAIEQTLNAHASGADQSAKTTSQPQSFPSPFLSSTASAPRPGYDHNSNAVSMNQHHNQNQQQHQQPHQQPRQSYQSTQNSHAQSAPNANKSVQSFQSSQQQSIQKLNQSQQQLQQHQQQQHQQQHQSHTQNESQPQRSQQQSSTLTSQLSHNILPTLQTPGKFRLNNSSFQSSTANPLHKVPKRDPSTSNIIHNLIPKNAILSPKKVNMTTHNNSSSINDSYELPSLDTTQSNPTYVRDLVNPQKVDMTQYQYQWTVPNPDKNGSGNSSRSSFSAPSAVAQTPRREPLQPDVKPKAVTPFRDTIFASAERSVTYQSELNQMLRLELDQQAKQQANNNVITYTIDPLQFAKKYTQNNTMRLYNPPKLPGQVNIHQSTVDGPIGAQFQHSRDNSPHQAGPVLSIVDEDGHHHLGHDHIRSYSSPHQFQAANNPIQPHQQAYPHPHFNQPHTEPNHGNQPYLQPRLTTNSYQAAAAATAASAAAPSRGSAQQLQSQQAPSTGPRPANPYDQGHDTGLPKPAFMMYATPKR